MQITMEEQDDDLLFEKLLRDKQHKELTSAINMLSDSIKKFAAMGQPKDNNLLLDKINDLSERINNIPKTEIDFTQLISVIESIKEKIPEKELEKEDEKEEKKEWEFTVNRGISGKIHKIIAVQK